MKFLIEEIEFIYVKLDTEIAKKVINESAEYDYCSMSIDELLCYDSINDNKCISKCIPVGSIEFIQLFYKKIYNIKRENSIEIPKELRVEEFVKRDYKILKYNQMPRKGKYFIKDATDEKTLTYKGDIELFNKKYSNNQKIKGHIFVCSEIVEIFAEYRFYVVRGKIMHFSCYKGNFEEMFDIKLIRKIISILNNLKNVPNSYSFDVMITKKGTSLIEVHSFLGLGLHNYMWGQELLLAYIDSHQYITSYNYEIDL